MLWTLFTCAVVNQNHPLGGIGFKLYVTRILRPRALFLFKF